MSDDKPSRAEQHLINEARKRQARQPQPPGTVTITRVAQFNGMISSVHWRTQAWSPDGTQLAYGGADKHGHGALHLWHPDSGHIESLTVRHLTHDLAGPVICLAWAPDGKHLASVEQDQVSGQPVVRIRSQAAGPRPVQLPPGLPAQQVAWSPDGGTLAVSGPDCPGTVLIDAASGAQRLLLDNLSGPVAWQPGGRLIAGVFESSVLLCDPATGGRVGRLAGQEHHATALAWDQHGKHLAVADGERIIVWEAEAGTIRWRLPWATSEGYRGPDSTITSIQWLDGGGYLMEFRPRGGAWQDDQGTTVATATIWDIEDGHRVICELLSHEHGYHEPPSGVAAGPDGRRLASAVDFHPAIVWQINGDLPHWVK